MAAEFQLTVCEESRQAAPDYAARKPDPVETYRRLDAYPEVPSVLAKQKRLGARAGNRDEYTDLGPRS